MKALSFLVILATLNLLPSYGIAQKTRIGFRGGANMTWVRYGDNFKGPDIYVDGVENIYDTTTRQVTPKPNFLLGGSIDYDLSDRVFLSTGITFQGMSHKIVVNNIHVSGGASFFYDTSYTFQLIAVQLPVLVHYRVGHFSIGGGVYGTALVSGKGKFRYSKKNVSAKTVQRSLTFTSSQSDPADFDRLDAGLRVEAGYGLKRWRVIASLDAGLTNTSPPKVAIDNIPQSYPSKRLIAGIAFLYQPWPR